MTRDEAADVASYAKTLFPVTSAERIVSLAEMLLAFSNPAFARQCMLHHSHQADANGMSIPTVRAMLEAEESRRRQTADQRRSAAVTGYEAAVARRKSERLAIEKTWQPIDRALDALDPAELEAAKAEVVKVHPFFASSNPRTNKALRTLIFEQIGGQLV